jgi:hypothetical protein
VPALLAAAFSAALTAELPVATVGAMSVKETAKLVVELPVSEFVAVIVTVYGLLSSPVPDQLHVPFEFCVTVPLDALSVTASS